MTDNPSIGMFQDVLDCPYCHGPHIGQDKFKRGWDCLLRQHGKVLTERTNLNDANRRLCDEITRLQKENAELREKLKPKTLFVKDEAITTKEDLRKYLGLPELIDEAAIEQFVCHRCALRWDGKPADFVYLGIGDNGKNTYASICASCFNKKLGEAILGEAKRILESEAPLVDAPKPHYVAMCDSVKKKLEDRRG